MRNKKAFTIIELIAVLVILAILALIVTPLVMNIINKAKISANKRSIDAYGRSIELAIASHMLDTGEIPTSIDELTIEYSGDEVVCETTQINSDSTVYLAGCTVGGKAVEGYTYGKDNTTTYTAYSVGDEVTYNNVDYYVIKDSGTNEQSVTLLKAMPITSNEISSYLSSTEVANKVDTTGTYATMAYYSAQDCQTAGDIGCSADYAVSTIKQVVDAWKTNYASGASEARLITYDDLTDNLGYEKSNEGTIPPSSSGTTPEWVENESMYWTGSQYGDDASYVWFVENSGTLEVTPVMTSGRAIRPVITISKSAL